MKKTRKKTVLNSALDELRKLILSGEYPGGGFLPPENQLSARLDISRGTLRTALKILKKEKILRTVQGKGSYILGNGNFERFERFIAGNFYSSVVMKKREALHFIGGACTAALEFHAECTLSFDDIRDPQKLIERYSRGNINGVLFLEAHDYEKEIIPLEKAGVPYVVANLEHDLPAVATKVDFRSVGRMAGNHLAELGHSRIAVLSGPAEQFIYREMLAGFRGGLAENEIFLDPQNIVYSVSRFEESKAAAYELLKKRDCFTAIFTTRDIRAAGLFQACQELGVDIPEELSVISYDNITWENAAAAGLTTIREPAEELGSTAVRMLKDWYSTGKRPKNVICDADIIIRNSTRKIN